MERERYVNLIAKLRHRQLVAAREGRFEASDRYARRAQRIRRLYRKQQACSQPTGTVRTGAMFAVA